MRANDCAINPVAPMTNDDLRDPVASADKPPWLLLAAAALLTSIVVSLISLTLGPLSQWPDRLFGPAAADHVRDATSVVGTFAVLSAIIPAVMAEHHRMARWTLVVAHVLVSTMTLVAYWILLYRLGTDPLFFRYCLAGRSREIRTRQGGEHSACAGSRVRGSSRRW